MIQKVERHVIRKNNANWQACHKLCSLSRKLGNCAVYLLRHRVFEKAPVLARKELDTELRHQYGSDYRAMPSAASAQRQGQVIAKQFKALQRRLLNTRSTLRSFKESLAYQVIRESIGHSMSAATAIKSAITD